jgi:hypothetical protein
LFRAAAARGVGGFDRRMEPAEDLDMWLKLGEVGQLANLFDVVMRYRVHTRSVSVQKRDTQLAAMRQACTNAWARRGITGHFEATKPWRPGTDRASRHEFTMRYGWWAFNSHQRRTAAIYGCRAVWLCPWSAAGWRLLACALVKPPGVPR